jgi:hypothetical protein
MAIKDLREFMALLDRKGQLKRIDPPLDPCLEIGEVTDRVSKEFGPGLLFESPTRHEDGYAYEMPVAINLFGTYERMAWALGVDAETGTWRDLDAVGRRLMDLLPLDAPASVWDKLGIAKNLAGLAGVGKKEVKAKNAPVQQVVLRGDDVDLTKLPVLKTWPEDGGPLTIRVHLKDKPATPYVESGELVLGLAADRAAYRINKPGCVLDPEKDIARGANHVFYALEHFASARLASAQVAVVSQDCPLFSIGESGVYGFRKDFLETPPEMRYTLFNNMWGTNFPQWIEGDFSFEFRVFSLDRDDSEGAYAIACDLCEAPLVGPLPFSLPDGVRLTRLMPDEEGLLMHLHSVKHAPIQGELSFPGYELRREDLLGRPLSDWTSGRISLDLPAYAVACCRVRAAGDAQ